MPDAIICFSDMEFDDNQKGIVSNTWRVTNEQLDESKSTLHENLKQLAKEHNIKLPKIIYWNISKKSKNNVPVIQSEENVIMLGGYSPSILPSLAKNTLMEDLSPEKFLEEVLKLEKYKRIENYIPFYKLEGDVKVEHYNKKR